MTDPAQFLDGMVHEPSQTEGEGATLTVSDVYAVEEAGAIDFGGDEYETPEVSAVETEKRDPGDDYGWWDLDAGQYLLAYNEALTDESVRFVLQPAARLLELGAAHPTAHVTELSRMPLAVGNGGVRIKENARVSRLLDPEG